MADLTYLIALFIYWPPIILFIENPGAKRQAFISDTSNREFPPEFLNVYSARETVRNVDNITSE